MAEKSCDVYALTSRITAISVITHIEAPVIFERLVEETPKLFLKNWGTVFVKKPTTLFHAFLKAIYQHSFQALCGQCPARFCCCFYIAANFAYKLLYHKNIKFQLKNTPRLSKTPLAPDKRGKILILSYQDIKVHIAVDTVNTAF